MATIWLYLASLVGDSPGRPSPVPAMLVAGRRTTKRALVNLCLKVMEYLNLGYDPYSKQGGVHDPGYLAVRCQVAHVHMP